MPGEHSVKPLPYAYDSLQGISKQVNEWHHDKHYAGYVNKRNEVEKELEKADRSGAHANWSHFGELKRRETFNACGQILHEIYYDIMGGDGSPPEGNALAEKIQQDFGSFDKWKEDFKAASLTALGWAVLAYDPSTGRLINFTGDTHNQGGCWGVAPLVPVDVFEHAYYHDYGPARAKYVDAFLSNLNWDKVAELFDGAPEADAAVGPGENTVKDLPYAYDSLEGISKQVNEWHHDKHYAGYVNKRNEVEKELGKADRSAANANWSLYGELKRRETFNANGQVLHEVYYDIMGGNGEVAGTVAEKLAKDFGSVDAWREDFVAAAKVGLGWAVLAWDPTDGKLRNFVGDSHNQGIVWGAVPLVTIDVFEHAYYHDYGPDRPSYIKAFLANLDWGKIDKHYEARVPK
jgi:Fe-Mn family superoxide dismutase